MQIDPGIINSVDALEWIAKVLSRGLLYGRHASQKLGGGMEFNQYRNYTPGDDLRLIDWKLYARTDKLFIRQSQIETDHNLMILLDSSPSMDYVEENTTKLLFGKVLTACMALIASNQGDAFGWMNGHQVTPFGTGSRHWHQCLHPLFKLTAQASEGVITPIIKPATVFVWITDLYATIDEIKEQIKQLKNNQTELIVFHLIGQKEENLDFVSGTTFIGLEDHQQLEVDAPRFREKYQAALQGHIHQVKNLFYQQGVQYMKAPMQLPIPQLLRQFLDKYNYLAAV